MTPIVIDSPECVDGHHASCPRGVDVLNVVCGCDCHAMMTRSMSGFDVVARHDEPLPTGPSARRTETQRREFAAGRHPVGLARLLNGDGGGKTCGDCTHLVARSRPRTYWKCELNESRSDATDVRKKWPACMRFIEVNPAINEGQTTDGNDNEEAGREEAGREEAGREEADDARDEERR